MSEHQHEDPVAHASTKITSYVSVAAMAAEALAQVAAVRAREHAASDERATRALRAERHAAYGQARLGWAPVLDPRLREQVGVTGAGTAWAQAQAWRPDPEAERVTHLAEARLAELRPDVMERYDRLRAGGSDPVEAMRRVAPLFDRRRPGPGTPPRTGLRSLIPTSASGPAPPRSPCTQAGQKTPAPRPGGSPSQPAAAPRPARRPSSPPRATPARSAPAAPLPRKAAAAGRTTSVGAAAQRGTAQREPARAGRGR